MVYATKANQTPLLRASSPQWRFPCLLPASLRESGPRRKRRCVHRLVIRLLAVHDALYPCGCHAYVTRCAAAYSHRGIRLLAASVASYPCRNADFRVHHRCIHHHAICLLVISGSSCLCRNAYKPRVSLKRIPHRIYTITVTPSPVPFAAGKGCASPAGKYRIGKCPARRPPPSASSPFPRPARSASA